MHAGILLRGPDVDGTELGMGMRAAHECCLEHVGKAQIRDEAAGTREQGAIFKPLDGVADKAGCCHGLHASLTVATGPSSTASSAAHELGFSSCARGSKLFPSWQVKVAVGEASRHSF